MKVLVVEDDPGIADVLVYALRAEGYETTWVQNAAQAWQQIPAADFILLDVGLPDESGFELCKKIRRSSNIPVIFLTARSDEIDRVVGLEIGADDYILKPFSPREVVARIKAVQRRLGGVQAVCEQGLRLDRPSFSVRFNGRSIELSRTEFDLLEMLAGSPGRVFTRAQILDHAWADGGCVTDRTVDAHIKSLRKKLGSMDCLETVRGVGYRCRKV